MKVLSLGCQEEEILESFLGGAAALDLSEEDLVYSRTTGA